MGQGAHPLAAFATDLRREHRAKPVLPEPQGLMSDVDAALMQEVLDVVQLQRVADVRHYRQTNDLRACLEVSKREVLGHLSRVGRVLPSLKSVCSDKAIGLHQGLTHRARSAGHESQTSPCSGNALNSSWRPIALMD